MTHEEFESLAALDALGAATTEEADTLRAHLGACIPCRAARDEYAHAATMLALSLEPVSPPAKVRTAVVGALGAPVERRPLRPPKEDRFPAAEAAAAPPQAMPWMSIAAAVFLALAAWQFLTARARQDEIARLRAQTERLSGELAALSSSETRTFALTGQVIAPSASAKVFLEPSRRRAVVFFHNLPENARNKSYQLWIIRADQPQPMSAGVFDAAKNGSASIVVENLPVETEIKALAVTLEPKGGVAQPTNTDFVVSGSI